MRRILLGTRFGMALLALAVVWSVAAPWLSANRFMSVVWEFNSYCLCFLGVICAAAAYISGNSGSRTWVRTAVRYIGAAGVLVVVVALWLSSNRAFFFWKVRAIPQSAWPEMLSDLDRIGRQSRESGYYDISASVAPPKSLQQLGTGTDYCGGTWTTVSSPEYNGVVAKITFGNKLRMWGIWVGPEEELTEFARPICRRVRVAPNAYFFVASRG